MFCLWGGAVSVHTRAHSSQRLQQIKGEQLALQEATRNGYGLLSEIVQDEFLPKVGLNAQSTLAQIQRPYFFKADSDAFSLSRALPRR